MMKLYSNSTDPFSHRCRIVLFEKGMDFEVIDVDLTNKSEDLSILSPYSDSPVLEERDLILTDPNIINEYLKYSHLKFSMLTPNIRQNVPCKMGSGSETSYYDSWSLVDHDNIQCMTWSSNPFYRKQDREQFDKIKSPKSNAFKSLVLI